MTNLEEYDYLFKCLIIGDSGIGKSSIVTRFVDNMFIDSYITTIGVDFKIKTLNINDKNVKLQIWDTAGQERFRTITTSYYRGAHIILLCYDITDRNSFNNLVLWLNEIKKYGSESVIIILCGTKLDMEEKRTVLVEEAQNFADTNNIKYIEISSKNDINIFTMFNTVILDKILKNDILTIKNDQIKCKLNNYQDDKLPKSCCL